MPGSALWQQGLGTVIGPGLAPLATYAAGQLARPSRTRAREDA